MQCEWGHSAPPEALSEGTCLLLKDVWVRVWCSKGEGTLPPRGLSVFLFPQETPFLTQGHATAEVLPLSWAEQEFKSLGRSLSELSAWKGCLCLWGLCVDDAEWTVGCFCCLYSFQISEIWLNSENWPSPKKKWKVLLFAPTLNCIRTGDELGLAGAILSRLGGWPHYQEDIFFFPST